MEQTGLRHDPDTRGQAALQGTENVLPLREAIRRTQAHIAQECAGVLESRDRGLLLSYIRQYVDREGFSAGGLPAQELAQRIYDEMCGFSVLAPYLDPGRTDIEEVNVNAYDDIWVTYADGRSLQAQETFFDADHAVDVTRRILHKSGTVFDESRPAVTGYLSGNIRVSAVGFRVAGREKGAVLSIRIVNPRKLSLGQFVENGTGTREMLLFLAAAYCYGVSVCLAGAAGSGKTTLMGYMLGQVPDGRRLVTIEEGCRELDCVRRGQDGRPRNSAVHLLAGEPGDAGSGATLTDLLRTALTIHPHYLAVAEMKGEESFLAISAAYTGHTVATTIHAGSCEDIYWRMAALCRRRDPMEDATLLRLASRAFPLAVFCRQGQDGTRRVTQIAECTGTEGLEPRMNTLWRFDTQDGGQEGDGSFRRVGTPSPRLVGKLRENGCPHGFLRYLSTAEPQGPPGAGRDLPEALC
ncbi:MAG: Flp pilus assembly complex ATPase component TadA [Clostridium sp.]|jgi:pilus assembly protein CpaF|nr:Flp pilus assembly complex ATPase component TadA [Clostridium sp.]